MPRRTRLLQTTVVIRFPVPSLKFRTSGVGSRNGAIDLGSAYLFLSVSSESASLALPYPEFHSLPHQTVRALFEHTAFLPSSSGSITTSNTQFGPFLCKPTHSACKECDSADPDICQPPFPCACSEVLFGFDHWCRIVRSETPWSYWCDGNTGSNPREWDLICPRSIRWASFGIFFCRCTIVPSPTPAF